MGEKPVRTQRDHSLRDNSPSSKGARGRKKTQISQAHPSYSKENQQSSTLKAASPSRKSRPPQGGMAKPPSQPQELPPYSPAVFACVPHSSLTTRVQVLFFWVVLRTSCSISHMPETTGASGKPTRCGLATATASREVHTPLAEAANVSPWPHTTIK